jgi:hypothetical protein
MVRCALTRNSGLASLGLFVLFAGGLAHGDVLDDAIAAYRVGDYRVAMPVFERLAHQGNPDAQFWLGSMWHQGRGKPSNFKEAFVFYRAAAYAGNADAQNNLGLLYRNGEGVEQNLLVAYAWLSLAAAQNNVAAKRNLDNLADRMNSDQILQGQQLTAEYLERIGVERSNRAMSRGIAMSPQAARPERPVALAAPPVPPAAQPLAPVTAAALPVSTRQTSAPQGHEATGRPSDRPMPSAALAEVSAPNPRMAVYRDEATSAISGGRPALEELFMVQLGLFRTPAGIGRIEQRLSREGLAFRNERIEVRGEGFQRIRLGPFATHEQARSMSMRMNQIFALQSAVIPLPR